MDLGPICVVLGLILRLFGIHFRSIWEVIPQQSHIIPTAILQQYADPRPGHVSSTAGGRRRLLSAKARGETRVGGGACGCLSGSDDGNACVARGAGGLVS